MCAASASSLSSLTTPFNHTTDFTELADHCQCFADELGACSDPAHKMALCGRLSACLALLQPTLFEPVPLHLQPGLTVDTLPTRHPAFEPDADQLADYCQFLTQLLLGGSLSAQMENTAEALLQDLVIYFVDTLKAPRWLNTPQGRVAIDL